MKIATWNVNSIKARLPRLLEWLEAAQPDVALLQELKVTDAAFPMQPIEDLGYNIATHGQKTYNGVAILSKRPIEDVRCGLPGDENDEQARYIEAMVDTVRVASIYLPNGNPTDSDKFLYKLAWMDRLIDHERKNMVNHVVDSLRTQESSVLKLRYGLIDEHEHSYAEIGRKMNLSRERIPQHAPFSL